MEAIDEAMMTAMTGLDILSQHRSKWVKEVSLKTMRQVEGLLGPEYLSQLKVDYLESWRKR